MKKWKLLAIALPMVLSSCGNKRIIDMTYTYKYLHVFATNTCYVIDSWTDYEGEQIQVTIKGVAQSPYCNNIYEDGTVTHDMMYSEKTTVLMSTVGVALITGECPFRHS